MGGAAGATAVRPTSWTATEPSTTSRPSPISTAAELNVWADPHAAAVVLGSGAPIALVPLDATNDVPVTPRLYDVFARHHDTAASALLHDHLDRNPLSGGLYQPAVPEDHHCPVSIASDNELGRRSAPAAERPTAEDRQPLQASLRCPEPTDRGRTSDGWERTSYAARQWTEKGAGVPAQLRIVLTGGPGGGKTTAVDLYRREIGDGVVVVPESATMLFAGGFPRVAEPEARRSEQRAIYEVQRNLEDIQAAQYPGRILLCDRGTLDGAAYWPDGEAEFFAHVGSSLERELDRYDIVLFFETAAVGGLSIEGGNRYRIESEAEALQLDTRLRALWSQHREFHLVRHEQSFLAKITDGLGILREALGRHGR